MNKTKFCYFLKKVKNKINKYRELINSMYYYNKINNLSNN